MNEPTETQPAYTPTPEQVWQGKLAILQMKHQRALAYAIRALFYREQEAQEEGQEKWKSSSIYFFNRADQMESEIKRHAGLPWEAVMMGFDGEFLGRDPRNGIWSNGEPLTFPDDKTNIVSRFEDPEFKETPAAHFDFTKPAASESEP